MLFLIMSTRIRIKLKTIRTDKIPNNLINLQKQAHDYLANLLDNYNFKKNKFYVGNNIEIAPAKQKVVGTLIGLPVYEFEFGFGANYGKCKYFHIWIKDKAIATMFNTKGNELMLNAILFSSSKKQKYPAVDFKIESYYSGFMEYKEFIEHNQVKRANGKIDKYFTATYRYVDNANNFRKFLNLIILDTRVEWVVKYKSSKRYSNGYPTKL